MGYDRFDCTYVLISYNTLITSFHVYYIENNNNWGEYKHIGLIWMDWDRIGLVLRANSQDAQDALINAQGLKISHHNQNSILCS